MSSLNPIVGVSVCIGALGAGLAYLAWNNSDDEDNINTSSTDQTIDTSDNKTEENIAAQEIVEKAVEKTVEEKTEKKEKKSEKQIASPKEEQPNMLQFLKETYESNIIE